MQVIICSNIFLDNKPGSPPENVTVSYFPAIDLTFSKAASSEISYKL
jgi:hypothetical protein